MTTIKLVYASSIGDQLDDDNVNLEVDNGSGLDDENVNLEVEDGSGITLHAHTHIAINIPFVNYFFMLIFIKFVLADRFDMQIN